jgi:hypothetical protein
VTETAAQAKYAEFEKKKVVITLGDPSNPDAETEELEGTVLSVTPVAIMFKPKGSGGSSILMVEQVLAMQPLATGPTTIKQKTLRPVELGGVRQHLADRHGFTLAWVNDHTEEQAAEIHNQQHIDLADSLGHTHNAAPPTAREQAIAGAEAESKDEEPVNEVMEGQEALF